jgi:N-acetylneuraminic acid mutarotase
MQRQSTSRSAFFNAPALVALLLCAAACSVVTGTLLAFLCSETSTNGSQRTLTFAQRVAYQRAIEEVYWRHRIWPKENPDPKPSPDAVMSQAQLENKVRDYLRKSQAFEDYWLRPITSEQLQAEMDRMAQHTKQPDVLRELFDALGNDPFIIAECLVRPALVERLLTHEALEQLKQTSQTCNRIVPGTATLVLPIISDAPTGCIDDSWTATSSTTAPIGRFDHTAVWTGTEMIVWGGTDLTNQFNTGGRYNPSTDSWTATTTVNAPSARSGHSAVWTGTEMIVWGGNDLINQFNTGGRYNPSTDSWTATSTTNAPTGRSGHTAVWTGSHMIVWGGVDFIGSTFNTGGNYNPSTNTWTRTTTTNAPATRTGHTAVWTGSEMIIWGGWNGLSSLFHSGGRYNPVTNSWTATSSSNTPSGRYGHTAVWTGSEMIVWGGGNNGSFDTGGQYNPSTNTWMATSTTNVPSARTNHTAVWSDGEMIVWGGFGASGVTKTGGRYNPGTNSWTGTSRTNAPSARSDHTAVWTGSEMIVWGGVNSAGKALGNGGRYCGQGNNADTVVTRRRHRDEGCNEQERVNDIGVVAMAFSPVVDVVATKRKEREKLGTMSQQCCKR